MLRVLKQGTLQTFQSSKTGEVISKIAVQFTDGLDTFEAEAFDKLALQLSQSPLNPQNVYAGQFTMSVSPYVNSESGRETNFNRVRISKINLVC